MVDITLCALKKIEVTNFVLRSWRVDSYLRMCSEGMAILSSNRTFFVYISHFGNARRIS